MGTIAMDVARNLLPELAAALRACGRGWTAAPLPVTRLTDDATSKIVVRDLAGRPRAMIIGSNPLAPDDAANALATSARVKSFLHGDSRDVILDPLAQGIADGLSYAVYPWCSPLSDNRLIWPLQRRSLRPGLFFWLREVLAATATEPTGVEVQQLFLAPLTHMARSSDIDAQVRQTAETAMVRLQLGLWQPRLVLAHNDLWKGNVLLREPGFLRLGLRAPFAIIDWTGARERGHAFYDLVRLSGSMNLEGAAFTSEVREQCRRLQCEPADARGYLLAGLGTLGMNPGHFPRGRFTELATDCCQKLFPATG